MIAAIQLKIRVATLGILCIDIGKFGHWQKSGPIILFKIDKGLKLVLNSVVLCFCLTINLWVESN